MEVDKHNWKKLLVPILKNIANASFVTFDLEMSGITTHPKHSVRDRSYDIGKPSLQQQYEEVKDAAETFQVLQLGITCVEEDREKEYYLARPYNINLSPLFLYDRVFDLERKFTFSSSATNFLQTHGFDFGAVFSHGVPYLSEQEELVTRERYAQRTQRNAAIPDIVFDPSDMDVLNFYRGARKTIQGWIDAKEPKNEFVNVDNAEGALNGFQRRLVHQLVRKEFPEHRCFPRLDGSFMQVERINIEREEKKKLEQQRVFNERVSIQTGVRFIFEALSGGDLSGIDPLWSYQPANPEEDSSAARLMLSEELSALTTQLKAHPPPLIGHNLFTDLIFLHRTFIGTLPVGIADFQSQTHTLFPTVIDTKYLATHSNTSMDPRSNLRELLLPLQKTHHPLILLHEEHNSYGTAVGKGHEAGFDSWMTAELFVKLSAKLYAEKVDGASEGSEESESEEDGGGAALFSPVVEARAVEKGYFMSSSTTQVKVEDDTHRPAEWHSLQLNKFAALATDFGSVMENGKGKKVGFTDQSASQWIPPMGDKFWEPYANKLRVNAVEGGVCDLNRWEREAVKPGPGAREKVRGAGDW